MWDVFISHAGDDKDLVARPLASLLKDRGLEVWYDEFSLKIGDSLSEAIDRGLAASRFGILILSPAFFTKGWTRRELRGLTTREVLMNQRILLPIWHQVSAHEVAEFSLPLADVYGIRTTLGLEDVADRIADVVAPQRSARYGRPPAAWQPPAVYPGYHDPIRAQDFEILTAAFAQPLQQEEERALVLVEAFVLPRAWDEPVPDGVLPALFRSLAETVAEYATADDVLMQVAEDEVGLVIPRGDCWNMVKRVAGLSEAVSRQTWASDAQSVAHCSATVLGARWNIDIPFWEALRRLRTWVEEFRSQESNYSCSDCRGGGHASRLNV